MTSYRISDTDFLHKFITSWNGKFILAKKILCSLLLCGCLISCATKASTASPSTTYTSPIDPYENYNRNAYRMNEKLDRWMIRPVAVWYIDYIPYPLRNTIANFYNNLRDFVTLGNDVLQLEGSSAMKNFMRISINSVFGIAGLLDISTNLGLPQTKNSFGNTFKVYGWKNSHYFVIPLLGPSTVRDAIGMVPDTAFNPTWFIPYPFYISIALFGVNGINTRTQFLSFDQILNTSVDPYITVRDVYLANIGESGAQGTQSGNEESIDAILEEDEKAAKKTGVPKSGAAATNKNEESIDEILAEEANDSGTSTTKKDTRSTPITESVVATYHKI
jgi:phospholipid-binding lipoprotein MlaA